MGRETFTATAMTVEELVITLTPLTARGNTLVAAGMARLERRLFAWRDELSHQYDHLWADLVDATIETDERLEAVPHTRYCITCACWA